MPKISAIIFFIFAILVWGTVAHSQLVRQVTPESATNPKPDDNDFIIPLPCDLTMAFRPIFIPEKGYLGEFEGSFGQDPVNTEGDETNFINQKHKVYLGSALSVESLPQAYQAKAQAIKKQLGNDQADRQLYLIGKYEVTNAQYEAVVNENCKLGADSARPVASVSFYDALNFTYKLMQYLLDQAPDSLPREQQDKRNIGILRLPTEEEWEYAARGGHMVSNESLTLEDFFPMEEGKTPKNYGLYYDEISPPVRTPTNIGSFQPNPAGIYDTIGNVGELIFATFKMTLGSRLHGSAGGPVSKGGSFRGVYADVTSGARQEFAFFFDTGPAKSTDLGFRVLISSVNTGSFERLDLLKAEYEALPAERGTDAMEDPMALVDSLIQNAKNDEEKKAFESLKTSLSAYNDSVNQLRVLIVKNYVQNLINMVMNIRTNSLRIEMVEADIKTAQTSIDASTKALNNPNTDANTKKLQEQNLPKYREDLATNQAELDKLNVTYDKLRARYNTLLLQLQSSDIPSDLFFAELASEVKLLTGKDSHTNEVKNCYDIVEENLNLVIKKKGKPESIKRADLELKAKK